MTIFTDQEVMQIMGRADALELRAEAAEARAAQLEAERDERNRRIESLQATLNTIDRDNDALRRDGRRI